MKHQLTIRENMWMGNGPILTYSHPIGYEVGNLPAGYRAYINNFGTPGPDDWQIFIIKDGESHGWFGQYTNAQAALAAIRGYVIEFVN